LSRAVLRGIFVCSEGVTFAPMGRYALLLCALGAQAEDIEPEGGGREPGLARKSIGESFDVGKLRVHDNSAPGADEVRVCVGAARIVAGAVVVEVQIEDFARLPEQVDGLVHGGKADGGVVRQNGLMDLLRRGVPRMVYNCLDDGDALRREAFAERFQVGEHLFEAVLRVWHLCHRGWVRRMWAAGVPGIACCSPLPGLVPSIRAYCQQRRGTASGNLMGGDKKSGPQGGPDLVAR